VHKILNPTYLVTGGAGFIGSHLVENLLSEGCHVRVLDNFSAGLETNLSDLSGSKLGNLEIICGDIRDEHVLNHAMQDVCGVFHLAALVSVPQSIEQPSLSFDINARGTHSVLETARKNGVKRVVVASSAAVYGDNQTLPLREDELSMPLSPYGLDKSFGEQMGKLFVELYQMNVTCLRFFNVFGPRQPPSSPYSGVVSIFANKAATREPAVFYGNGEQTRDFVYVKDVVAALKLAMQSNLMGFYVYNVGSGNKIAINELWNAFSEISGFHDEASHRPERPGDIKNSLANIAKIKKDLDFLPSNEFMNNLRDTYNWLRLKNLGQNALESGKSS
jgi:nucleoside-diphosphate-sugar epimerase